MDWKIISKQRLYDGFLSIDEYQLSHDLYAGGETEILTRELMERGHAVAVLLYDPVKDKLILIEQFRIGAKDDKDSAWLLELVAGMIEDGESEEEVVRRECLEEAGVEIQQIKKIFSYYSSPGGCSEKVTLYYAEVDSVGTGGIHGLASENEDIKVVVLDYEQVMAELKNGKINSATPIIALQWLQLQRDNLIKHSHHR